MRLDDRLVKDQQRVEKAKTLPDAYYDSEAAWMEYKNREKETPLDRYKGAFAVEDKKSINTRPSVFDATTVFKTGE